MTGRLHALAAAFAAALLLGAAAAHAADGEILINQAKVNAGGITPGDTAGFPATLSRPGHYKLSGNLSVPAGVNGIDVTANDVTIDLNGFTISSNPPGQAARGINSSEEGLHVINGTVTGFSSYAIVGQVRSAAERMRLVSNNGFAAMSFNLGSRVRDSIVADNAMDGIICFRCLITGNVVTGNGGDGVSAAGGQVLDNVIAGNGLIGVYDGGGAVKTGYGENILIGNNGGGGQTLGQAYQIHPNVCDPACP
jgi:hypothetical protein